MADSEKRLWGIHTQDDNNGHYISELKQGTQQVV